MKKNILNVVIINMFIWAGTSIMTYQGNLIFIPMLVLATLNTIYDVYKLEVKRNVF